MSELFSFLLVFIIALGLGLFIGKLLFSARFDSQKISLEEKNQCCPTFITAAKRTSFTG